MAIKESSCVLLLFSSRNEDVLVHTSREHWGGGALLYVCASETGYVAITANTHDIQSDTSDPNTVVAHFDMLSATAKCYPIHGLQRACEVDESLVLVHSAHTAVYALGDTHIVHRTLSLRNVVELSARGCAALLRTAEGEVYMLTARSGACARAPLPPHEYCVAVSAGPHHFAAVGRSGLLFTWGDGAYGKLGHGSDENKDAPQCVQALQGVGRMRGDGSFEGITRVACGMWHTVALASNGDVYSWGWSRFGQTALHLNIDSDATRSVALEKIHWSPERVQFLDALCDDDQDQVCDVCCGSRFSAFLTQTGKLFVVGLLGFHEDTEIDLPDSTDLTHTLNGLTHPRIHAGRWHLMVEATVSQVHG